MADEIDQKVVALGLRPERAQQIIRETAKDTSRVILGDHAKERLAEREISDIEIYHIFQSGFVLETPTRTKRKEWKCKSVMKLKGNRDAGVVAIILSNGLLFVKTVEW